MPGYVYHLLRRAVADGLDLSSIRYVVLGAERVPPGLKDKITCSCSQRPALATCSVFGTYGFTEARMAWAECPTKDNEIYTGYHLYPDMAIFEVIDPKTGEVVPDGEDGELVFTPLKARASTVFRYRTGDRVRGGLQWEPCPHCGRTVPRISSDLTPRVQPQGPAADPQGQGHARQPRRLRACCSADMRPRSKSGRSSSARRTTIPHEVDETRRAPRAVKNGCRQDEQVAPSVCTSLFKSRLEITPNQVRRSSSSSSMLTN